MPTRTRQKRTKDAPDKLDPYRKKRHFERTPEPSGARKRAAQKPQGLRFVVQKHAARNLHYDFRLELSGVLLSWSVPKGPSLEPGARRLAVRTEDHPLEYADFEGVIPKGEYGGGTVLLWDRGTWLPEDDAQRALARGRLTFELRGEKLRGRFHLVRTRLDGGKRENWLLFKGRDDQADAGGDVLEQAQSVASGRSLEQIAAAPEDVWHSDRTPQPAAAMQDTVALVKQLKLPFGLTNLEKVLYPEADVRKADVIAYYAAVQHLILPHIAERPLTLVRCPNGHAAKCFFQKHKNEGVPACVHGVPLQEGGERGQYMMVRDLPGLLALPQLGALELHTWGCHVPRIEQPDKLVFDLDPGPDVVWDSVVEAAVELRMRLSDIGLQSFVQTTGGKGLHVVAPIAPRLDWEAHKQLAFSLVHAMERERPKRYVTNMRKSLRQGRIFLDYLRNGRGATAIAPYSTRARPNATVAAPLTWDELMAGVDPQQLHVRSMMSRIGARGYDPWPHFAGLRQQLGARALRSLGLAKRSA